MVQVAAVADVVAVAVSLNKDRIGLGWRPELAWDIQQYLDHIDVIEVIADNWFKKSKREVKALASLNAEIPVVLHGVGMGLASSWPVPVQKLEAMARLVEIVQPEVWSEHLAFVRAGGIEIGHLCAPPRTAETIAGALENIALAERIVGSRPWLENIASLIEPPASTMNEAEWVGAIVEQADAKLVLDLHNLYANAVNRGQDPLQLLESLPLQRVAGVHLSGGKIVFAPNSTVSRLLDDHLHDPPDAVYELLSALAQRAPQTLMVTIERDGDYPPISLLLEQVQRARAALAAGRALL